MRYILLFLFFIISTKIHATFQIPNVFIYKGQEYEINQDPMSIYFNDNKNKRDEILKDANITSANWNGYVAIYEIVENKLKLKDITISKSKKFKTIESQIGESYNESIIDVVFPFEKDRNLIWYNEEIILPTGKIKEIPKAPIGVTFYDSYTVLEIENGFLNKEYKINYEDYINKNF